MRTLITHGTVVTASDTFVGNVLIDGEHIASIRGPADERADRTIDAANKLVLPGGVDVHTHLDLPVGDFSSADDFESGTMAAAYGGTTTIIDYATQFRGQTLRQALDEWHGKADGKAAIDYAFPPGHHPPHARHRGGNGPPRHRRRDVLQGLHGVRGHADARRRSDSRVLARAAGNGALVCVHAEDGPAIAALVARALGEGRTAPRYHAVTRPVALEREAVGRAVAPGRGRGLPHLHRSSVQRRRPRRDPSGEGAWSPRLRGDLPAVPPAVGRGCTRRPRWKARSTS